MLKKRLFIILSFLSIAAVTAQAQNDLVNPGFEDANFWDVNEGDPGWQIVTSTATQSVSMDDTLVYDGNYSARLVSDSPDGAWAADLQQFFDFNGPALVLRFNYTAVTNYGSFGIDVQYFSDPNTQIEGEEGWDWLNPQPGTGEPSQPGPAPMEPGEWVELTYTNLFPPEITEYIFLRFRVADGPVTLHIDNVYAGPPPRDEASWIYPVDGGWTTAEDQRNCPNGPTLRWQPALDADGDHILYFGTSFEAVDDANTSDPEHEANLPVGTTSYTLGPGAVEREQTYYWRVDQTIGPNVVKQDVWQFSVWSRTWIDTFDDYNDPEIQAIWGPNATSGNRIMQIDYNSTNYEVSADTCDLLCSPDVSENAMLVLEVRGHDDMNDNIYVELVSNDGAESGVVTYPDSRELNQQSYEPFITWEIDLQEFASQGVVLTNVTGIKIGVGDSAPSGSGTVNIDDVRLDYPYCIAELIPADFDNDCNVGMQELEMLVNNWLAASYEVTAAAPSPGPILWYKFDEGSGSSTVEDSSVNDYHGFLLNPKNPDAWGGPGSGYDGTGDSFKPDPDPEDEMDNVFVDIDIAINNDHNTIGAESTISIWLKDPGQPDDDSMILQLGNPDSAGVTFQVFAEATGSFSYTAGWNSELGYSDELLIGETGYTNPDHPQDEWVHYAFVKSFSGGYMRAYRNGELIAEGGAEASETPTLDLISNFASLGAWQWSGGGGGYVDGLLDDLRIYDYALSHEEVLYLTVAGGVVTSPLTQGLITPSDATGDDVVNFYDLAKVAEFWLQTVVWP